MKLIHLTASAAALGFILGAAAPALAQASNDKDPLTPIDAELVQLTSISLMPSGWPDRATGVDLPMDMSVGNATAQSMVNSGQVSPAAGAAGGLLGALVVAAIDAGIDANRNAKIQGMLAEKGFDGRAIFEAALVDALTQGQLTPAIQTADRPAKGFFTVAAKPDSLQEAAVDVLIHQYGFTVDGIGWHPSVAAQVKVYDLRTGALIMNESLTYGRPGHTQFGNNTDPGSMTIVVPFDFSQGFKDVKAYTETETDRAVYALTVGLQETAKAVANLVLVAGPDLTVSSPELIEAEAVVTETEAVVMETSAPAVPAPDAP